MGQDRKRNLGIVIDGYDHIEVASIDSFPASDPPAWIEAKARPCLGESGSAATKTTRRRGDR